MKKTSTIANFNCTFGKENKPMLTYFEEIIYPAFTNGYIREVKGDKYFFENVQIKELKNSRYVLQGILVRKTKLEVKTEYNEDGLKFTNKFYDTAPISIFTLFLDNHRLIYTTNQKGSPSIKSFSATVKNMIKKCIIDYNKDLEKEDRIPLAKIDIVDIPEKSTIEEKLKSVEKIKKVSFRFFNLNGDFNTGGAYDWMSSELEKYGSPKGEIIIKSPTKVHTVTERLAESKGFADVSLDVKYLNGGEGKIDNSSISEKFSIDVPKNSTINTVATVTVDTLNSNKFINDVGEENQRIYNNSKSIIKKLFNK